MNERLAHLVVTTVLGVAAFTLVLTATDPPGPGLDPDAMAYMGAAESLVAHGQYRAPGAPWWRADSTEALTHFPPGYPTALALPVRLGMTPPQAARLVDATAAAATTILLGLLVAEAAGLAAGTLATLALLATPAMALVHVSVLSEPLFLTLMTLLLVAMTRRATRPLLVGLLAALAATVRYAGLAFVGAGVVWVVAARGTVGERMRRGVFALLPSALLQGAWLLRTRALREPGQIRRIALYGNLEPTLRQGGRTLRDWLVPDPDTWEFPLPNRPLIALAAATLVTLLVVAGVRRVIATRRATAAAEPDRAARLLAASALLAACYLGLLVASRLVADPAIPFDERILAPWLVLATVAIAVAVTRAWPRSLAPRLALGAALVAWGMASASTTRGQVRYVMTNGSDFAGDEWRRSALLDWARGPGATHPLYSNWPSAVYFHLHRPARYLPLAKDSAVARALVDTLRARDARVLLFDVAAPGTLATGRVLREPGLRVLARLDDGVVVAASPRQ